jgi:methionyl-tRNA synthetase
MPKDKFYITTSIAYANSFPHIGFALESVQADVLARKNHQSGKEVFFLTGTDEHGRKVTEAAEKAGKSPREFVDQISAQFKKLSQVLNLSCNDFIRTSDAKRHWPSVKKVWLELKEKGDIYKKKYQGLYCVGCEAFITKKDLKDGKCPFHQKEPEIIEEENHFFRLSKYSKEIEKIIREDKIKIIPETRKNEMLSFASRGLEDVSFSRPRKDLKWAIEAPEDPSFSIYVWADALTNYLSAIGYADNKDKFNKFWPADIHCIGKDIQKFHCLIWPGMLLSLGLPLPRVIFVHGFITTDGQKMSKSLGNIIDPLELVEKYGTDPVRYFLLREIPSTEDGDFTRIKFEQRYNSDLAKGLGNLVARIVTLANKFDLEFKEDKLSQEAIEARNDCQAALDKFKFNEGLVAIWKLIGWCDRFIEKERPWEGESLEKKEKNKKVIARLMRNVAVMADLLYPFLPETSEKIKKQLREGKSSPLFPRLEI